MCTRRVAIISSQALMGTVKIDLSEYISLFLLKPFRLLLCHCFYSIVSVVAICCLADGNPVGTSYTEDRLYHAQRLIQESIGTCETRWRSEGMRNLAMVKNYIMSARDAYMDGNMNTYYYRMLRAHRYVAHQSNTLSKCFLLRN